jgi:hypothetical protein
MILKRASAIVALWFAMLLPASADDSALKAQFLTAYREPGSRLEQFYRHIDMTEVPAGNWAKKRYGEKATLRWRASGNRFRDDAIDANGIIIRSHLSLGDVKCAIKRIGKDNAGASAPVIDKPVYAITSIMDVTSPSLLSVDHTESPRLAFAPFCIHDEPVHVFVARDNVTVAAFDDQDNNKATLKLTVRRENGSEFGEDVVFKGYCQ